MTARLPRRVKIGGHVWTVARVRLDRDLGGLLGRTVIRHNRIEVDQDQAADQERETVLHELLHAIAANTHAFGDDDDLEERGVRILTPWLLALLRDNPSLVFYLTGCVP